MLLLKKLSPFEQIFKFYQKGFYVNKILSVMKLTMNSPNCEQKEITGINCELKNEEKEKIDENKIINNKEEKNENDKKKNNNRPNVFLSIPITQKHIKEKFKLFGKSWFEKEPLIKPILISPSKIHLTMGVFQLKTEEEEKMARESLEWCKETLSRFPHPLFLTLEGLDRFSGDVLFSRVVQDDHFDSVKKIYEILLESFESKRISHTQNKSIFKPHVTIAKLSKISKFSLKKKLKKSIKEITEEQKDEKFGKSEVRRIDLCWMNHKMTDKNKYKVLHSVVFKEEEESEEEEEEENEEVKKIKKIDKKKKRQRRKKKEEKNEIDEIDKNEIIEK